MEWLTDGGRYLGAFVTQPGEDPIDNNGEDLQQLPVEVHPDDVDFIQSIAAEHGLEAQVLPQTGFEPVSTVTVLLFGATAAFGAVMYLLEQRKGGQVIDLRRGATPPVYRDRNLQYGLVLVYTRDGRVTVDVKEPKGAFGTVVDAIRAATVGLGEAGAEAVASVVRASVDDEITVTSTT
jgi:hypothetical protein